MDTQGSELLILEGAAGLLERFDYIKAEAADFEAYQGGCLLSDLTAFLVEQGFHEVTRTLAAEYPDGHYYDLTFRRQAQQSHLA